MSVTETGTRARQPDTTGYARSQDGLRLYYEVFGTGSTTIVFLPANPISHSRLWKAQVHYLARHGEARVAKAAIISAVPPLMVKTAANPAGLPKEVFDGFQAQLAGDDARDVEKILDELAERLGAPLDGVQGALRARRIEIGRAQQVSPVEQGLERAAHNAGVRAIVSKGECWNLLSTIEAAVSASGRLIQ